MQNTPECSEGRLQVISDTTFAPSLRVIGRSIEDSSMKMSRVEFQRAAEPLPGLGGPIQIGLYSGPVPPPFTGSFKLSVGNLLLALTH